MTNNPTSINHLHPINIDRNMREVFFQKKLQLLQHFAIVVASNA